MKRKLLRSFFLWFFILVVLPVFGIFFALKTVYQDMIKDKYHDYIVQKEKNIADSLQSEMKEASRLLASACLVNHSEILQLAADKKNSEDAATRFALENQLKAELNYTFLHRSEIGSIVFFFAPAGTEYYRSAMTSSEQISRESDWYREALIHRGEVSVSGIRKGVADKFRTRYTLELSFCPKEVPQDSGVELVHLSYFTHALENTGIPEEQAPGTMLVLNENGLIMMSDEKAWEGSYLNELEIDKKAFLITTYDMASSDLQWKIVNISSSDLALQALRGVSLFFFVTIGVVLLLFGIFAAIFFKRISVQEKEKLHLEMEALQTQINPHFISNTLNAIRFMAMVAKFESIEKMMEALIQILNTTFRTGNEITVQKEVETLQRYLYIMQIRYGGKFSFEFDIAPDILLCQMLKLLLQPLVENAIVHGFEGQEEGSCRLMIKGYQKEHTLYFEVIDNGKGMNQEQKFGIGLINIRQRIEVHYGKQYGIRVDSESQKGTNVMLTLPVLGGVKNHSPVPGEQDERDKKSNLSI